jgi:hypothetical protein
MHTLGRILVQLFLSGPLAIFYPVLVFGIGYAIVELLSGRFSTAANLGLFVAGGLGLTGLYVSILLPLDWLQRRWLRWTVTTLMAFGVLLALLFGWTVAYAWHRDDNLWQVWMYGGPLAVAAWNLWRMHAAPRQKTEEAR